MEDESGKKVVLSRAEKFKNYGIGIGAMSALLLGIWANVKGEPTAEKTWETLRDQMNNMAETVNKLSKRVIFLQAHESGRTAAEIQLKLDAADKKIASLEAKLKTSPAPASKPAVAVLNKSQKKCKEGFVLVDRRCHRAPKAVARKLAQDAAERIKDRRKLLEEKRKRIDAERRKKALMQQIQSPPPPAPLRMLPRKLDEAGK
jgi:hypothetical protein